MNCLITRRNPSLLLDKRVPFPEMRGNTRAMPLRSPFVTGYPRGGAVPLFRCAALLDPESATIFQPTLAFFFSPFGYGYYGGGGILSLLFWGVLAAFAFQAARRALPGSWGNDEDDYYEDAEKYSVGMVQVGLLGSAREIQVDLERIARKADTTTSSGLHFILQETVLALMRNPQYCVYGFSKSGTERGLERAESRFNELSLKERGKFEKETLVNVGGRSIQTTLGKRGGQNELIVVTLLVAAACPLKLPKASSGEALKEALAKLGSVSQRDLVAIEILWTPEEEGDFFTEDDLVADYPNLNRLI